MYMNVLYIPWFAGLITYIHKPATSSHAKPGLLKLRLWLGLPQIPESFIHNSRILGIWTHNFAGPWFQRFASSWFHISATSWFQIFAISWFQISARIVHPKTDWEFKYKCLVRPLFLCQSKNLWNIRKLLRFFISPFSRKFEPFSYSRFANMFHEFRHSDISRMTWFYRVPQHYPLGEAGWLWRSVSTKTYELW
jgi:hypothetical protein